jgi:hypothetical protein
MPKPEKVEKGYRRSIKKNSVKGNFKVVVDPLTGLFKVELGEGGGENIVPNGEFGSRLETPNLEINYSPDQLYTIKNGPSLLQSNSDIDSSKTDE